MLAGCVVHDDLFEEFIVRLAKIGRRIEVFFTHETEHIRVIVVPVRYIAGNELGVPVVDHSS